MIEKRQLDILYMFINRFGTLSGLYGITDPGHADVASVELHHCSLPKFNLFLFTWVVIIERL